MTQSLELYALDHLVLTVADIQQTIQFYERVLGMRSEAFVTATGEKRWALKYGSQKINLHQQGAEFDPKADRPTPGSADLCFLTQFPLARWHAHFEKHAITILEGPVPRTGAQGPIMSLYIRDPDQNLIEVAHPQP